MSELRSLVLLALLTACSSSPAALHDAATRAAAPRDATAADAAALDAADEPEQGPPPTRYSGAAGTLGSFRARTVFDRSANVAWPNESTLIDLDNDGVADWLIGAGFLVKPVGALVWMRGDGLGNFGPVRQIAVPDPSCWYHKALPMDVDRDADMDFVTSCHVGTRNDGTGESRLEWFENPGDASGLYRRHALAQGGISLHKARFPRPPADQPNAT